MSGLQAQTKPQIFDTMYHICIVWFLHAFYIAWGNLNIHKGAATWSFQYFLKKSAAAALSVRLRLKSKWLQYSIKEGVLTTYCQLHNHLLDKYVTENFISETDGKITHYVKPSTLWSLEFENERLLKTLRCSNIYDEYVSKKISVGRLSKSIT